MTAQLIGSNLLRFLNEGLGASQQLPPTCHKIKFFSKAVHDLGPFTEHSESAMAYSPAEKIAHKVYKELMPRLAYHNPSVLFECEAEAAVPRVVIERKGGGLDEIHFDQCTNAEQAAKDVLRLAMESGEVGCA